MTLEKLTRVLVQRNIKLTPSGERLLCSAPVGALTAELRESINLHKAALLRPASTQSTATDTIPVLPRGCPIPLTDAQERLWFVERLRPSRAYNLTAFKRGITALDIPALEKAVAYVVQRHESLRTSFAEKDGVPLQVIANSAQPRLEIIDLPASDGEAEFRHALEQFAEAPFDFSVAPLMRAAIFRGSSSSAFAIVVHHIVADGWALGILMEEIGSACAAFQAGDEPALPSLPVQYSDYAEWRRQRMSEPRIASELNWWRKRLENLPPVLDLPVDRPRPSIQSSEGATLQFEIDNNVSAALREVCRREHVTLYVLLLAVLKLLLSRYSGQKGIAVGTPVTSRSRPELERVVGHFANTLVLRTDVLPEMTARDLVRAVRETVLESHCHADIPFEKLVNAIRPSRSLSYSPLFQVSFVLDNTPNAAAFETLSCGAKFDLSLYMWEAEGGAVGGSVEYCTALFDKPTIERMTGHFKRLVSQFTTDLDQPVGLLDMLQSEERKYLLEKCNSTSTSYPRDACVHDLFAAIAMRLRNKPAVVETGSKHGVSLTYAELDQRSQELAEVLRTYGVGPEVMVGVAIERSADAIVAFLAVLRAGGAYVPLDPDWPLRRLEYTILDTQMPLLLARSNSIARMERFGVPVLDIHNPTPRPHPDQNNSTPSGESMAYIMYTSGSTGEPKGVCVVHRGIVRLVRDTNYASLGEDEVILACAPVTFDASTFEIWGALLNGGTVCILLDRVPSPSLLESVLTKHAITTLWLTAGLFHQLIESGISCLTGVRQLLAGGDVLSPFHVSRLLQHPGHRVLVNGYGPTENTTFTCCYRMESGRAAPNPIPIGTPVANTVVYILDSCLQPVPLGVPGELYTGGDGLARGYLNQPQSNASHFVANPFSTKPGDRLYRTGDIVRRNPDGVIEFLGRADTQVKVRGFRVELAEIESAVLRHPAVRECVVDARTAFDKSKYLACYVVPRTCAGKALADELQEFLADCLPDYMIPSSFVVMEVLPLSPNGKVDRAALPEPARKPVLRLAPGNSLEAEILNIWKHTIGVPDLGVNENFFEVGGHSLLAVKLLAELEKKFGSIPLSLIFEAPTVEQLARKISNGNKSDAWRSLVAIQPTGHHPPLFLVPGIGGNVLCFSELAAAFGPEYPLYGLQSVGLNGGKPLAQIEDIAAHFIAEIRSLQPHGPYYVAGACMGGAVAWEIAQQLVAAGEQVALLTLLETWPPHLAENATQENLTAMRLRNAWRALFHSGWTGRRDYFRRRLEDFGRILRREPPLPEDLSLLYRLRVTAANGRAFARYRPSTYHGPVAFFLAADRNISTQKDPQLYWVSLAKRPCLIHMVNAATSGDLVKGRAAQEVAARYKTLLSETAAMPASPPA